MQESDLKDPGLSTIDICSIIEGKVQEIKDYGGVVKLEKYDDIYGFISPHQCKDLC